MRCEAHSILKLLKQQIMKKLLAIGLILIANHGFSQGLIKGVISRLSFGLKAGANYSNYTNANFNTDGLLGFHAGALVDFKITNNLSFREEFLFSTQGAKIKDSIFTKENIKVSYFAVPLLLNLHINWGLYIEAGSQVGLRVGENIGDASSGNFAKRLDMALVGGLGYQTRIGLGIGLRYVGGISSVGDFKVSGINPNFRNSTVQASIFYIF
jgi:hypothetical protein